MQSEPHRGARGGITRTIAQRQAYLACTRPPTVILDHAIDDGSQAELRHLHGRPRQVPRTDGITAG